MNKRAIKNLQAAINEAPACPPAEMDMCAKVAGAPAPPNPHELRARLMAAHVALEAVRYDIEINWEARNQVSTAIAARLGSLELTGR